MCVCIYRERDIYIYVCIYVWVGGWGCGGGGVGNKEISKGYFFKYLCLLVRARFPCHLCWD